MREDIESLENADGLTFFLRASKYEMTPLNMTYIRDDYIKTLNVSFEGAEVPSKQIDVSCDASFGTIYLYLPRNWRVINKVSASFGGCDDKAINSNPDSADVTCTIVGSASFGEIRLFRV